MSNNKENMLGRDAVLEQGLKDAITKIDSNFLKKVGVGFLKALKESQKDVEDEETFTEQEIEETNEFFRKIGNGIVEIVGIITEDENIKKEAKKFTDCISVVVSEKIGSKALNNRVESKNKIVSGGRKIFC